MLETRKIWKVNKKLMTPLPRKRHDIGQKTSPVQDLIEPKSHVWERNGLVGCKEICHSLIISKKKIKTDFSVWLQLTWWGVPTLSWSKMHVAWESKFWNEHQICACQILFGHMQLKLRNKNIHAKGQTENKILSIAKW